MRGGFTWGMCPPRLSGSVSQTKMKGIRHRQKTLTVLLVVTVSGYSLSGCLVSCENEEQSRTRSTDGKLEAVLFQRDCGATTPFTSQVSVVPAGAALGDEPGNVFTSDTNHGAAPSASWGGPPVTLRWLGPRHLLLTYHPRARIGRYVPEIKVRTGWFASESILIDFDAAENVAPAGS